LLGKIRNKGEKGDFKMSAVGVHKITAEFEAELCRYTGAKYAVAVDNCCNGLALCLWLWRQKCNDLELPSIEIPSRTYPGVTSEIRVAGFNIKFQPVEGATLTGEYQLQPTNIWDSALRFTADMYRPGQMQCISFTGSYKHLKLGKGGAILLDNEDDYNWLKKARNSGRDECSYHDDTFTMLGRNCYMMPEIAARGLLLMGQFYNLDGSKKHNEDLTLPYPDLSLPKHTAYK
jgi:dTDP-4-amino-4,6-dideoxygalactose transaminase